MPARGDLAVIIPARNESDRIGATVKAASEIPGVDIVVVVDDGSVDGTGAEAAHAGAIVARHARNRGKAAAMETGADAVRVIEARDAPEQRRAGGAPDEHRAGGAPDEHRAGGAPDQHRAGGAPDQHRAGGAPDQHGFGDAGPRHLLFLDADLAETAANASPLTEPVLAGQADMTIAVFASREKRGGHGLVLGLAGAGIERATGWRPAEPLNGQRCMTRAAFEAAKPLADGWGVETGLTIDLHRKGMRIAEVQVPLAHRATGSDLASQVHRAHQFADVAKALVARKPWRHPPAAGQPATNSIQQADAE